LNNTKRDTTIVHITPHLGGGVGSCLSNFIRQSEELGVVNKVYCLDWCDYIDIELRRRVNVSQGTFWNKQDRLQSDIQKCNCVLIHYWNHPLLTVFLSRNELPKIKSMAWCHNSGLAEPHIIPSYLTNVLDRIVFTSGSSAHIPNYEKIKVKLGTTPKVIPSVRDLREFLSIGLSRTFRSSNLKLIYVGAVTKAKMHAESAFIFAELSKQGIQIEIVGGPDHCELAKQVESLGGKVKIFGHVENVKEFYKNADLFIYPLRVDHYGTGEQVMQEALASGLPIVAFNNSAEVTILNQFPKIRLAKTTSEFIEIAAELVKSPVTLFELSKEVYQRSLSISDSNKMTKDLLAVVSEVGEQIGGVSCKGSESTIAFDLIALYARACFFDEEFFNRVLIESDRAVELVRSKMLDGLKNLDQIDTWRLKTKSSPQHYLSYFPDDKKMSQLVIALRDL
jgi:glycosyltransferase involved in cell wall biosynthesis